MGYSIGLVRSKGCSAVLLFEIKRTPKALWRSQALTNNFHLANDSFLMPLLWETWTTSKKTVETWRWHRNYLQNKVFVSKNSTKTSHKGYTSMINSDTPCFLQAPSFHTKTTSKVHLLYDKIPANKKVHESVYFEFLIKKWKWESKSTCPQTATEWPLRRLHLHKLACLEALLSPVEGCMTRERRRL